MSGRPLTVRRKAQLAARIWSLYVDVRRRVHREPLPTLVQRLDRAPTRTDHREHPLRLSRAVDRALRVGSRRPTCLVNALVLYRLLRDQGDRPELVIGLPSEAAGPDAHAWVELGGVDVGPPPGRSGHAEMARFGR